MAGCLIDNWVQEEGNASCDVGGAVAAQGRVDEGGLAAMLDNDWFDLPPPKSLDREDFTIEPVRGLSLADGAATLTAFTVHAIELGLRQLPMRPRTLFTAGGGRHNATMMHMLAERTGIRSEEHTSELQSLMRISYAVFCLKKKNKEHK